MSVHILGPVQVRRGAEVFTPKPRLARIFLAALTLRANRPVSSQVVSDALWGGRPPKSATSNLRSYLAGVRQLLPAESGVSITLGAGGYCLRAPDEAVDVLQFSTLAAEGRALLAAGNSAEASSRLSRGLALWRGPALAGETAPDCLQGELHALEVRRLDAIEDNIAARLALAEHRELIVELTVLVGERPLRERLTAQLMLALYRSGRQVEALQAYQSLRSRLDDELGVLPSTEIRQLHRQILRADPALDQETPARTRRLPDAGRISPGAAPPVCRCGGTAPLGRVEPVPRFQ